jgi:hypothetical protein
MNKETKKKLLAPFPKEVVQDPPKGKFGKFVNHAVYVERLRDCDVDYEWEFEPIIINDKVIGAIGKLTIDGKVYQGAGDVEAPALARATTGECLKLAESDAFKRASMRAGLGVELWSGTDDFYMEDTTQPIQKTGRVKDIVIEKEEQEALNKAKQDFAKEIGAEEDSVSDQLNDILEGMCPDKQIRSELKKTSYDKCVEEGMSKEVDDWSDDEMKTFLSFFGDSMNNNAELLSAVTTDISDTKMQCPESSCNKFDTVVDNREKKNSDPKFAKIPDFACDNYGADKDGCGKGWWIGGDDFPFEKWL